jgi:D-3-phosphoglycerate dehydrogenase
MRVLFYDHTAKLPMGNNAAASSLAELLSVADFVSLHVPETPETRHMIGEAQLAAMKRGSYLLNASRGTVVVIPALAAALRAGHLGGAAVDVYPEEPESNAAGFLTPLQRLPNVILTPHIGGSTSEAQAAIGREVATVLIKLVRNGATSGAVNFPLVEPPPLGGARRILNVHHNVPGVLRDINKIVSDLQANIRSQMLATDPEIGYLVMDLDQDVSTEVHRRIAALPTNIRTRIV